jgi:hypothetical protein
MVSGLEITGVNAGTPPLLRFRLPRLDRCDPGFCPASDVPASDGFTPDSESFTFLIHNAAQDQRPQQALHMFNVGANVSACHQIDKFFFGPARFLYGRMRRNPAGVCPGPRVDVQHRPDRAKFRGQSQALF